MRVRWVRVIQGIDYMATAEHEGKTLLLQMVDGVRHVAVLLDTLWNLLGKYWFSGTCWRAQRARLGAAIYDALSEDDALAHLLEKA